MITANPEYLSLEAIKHGVIPIIKATISPYYYPSGITAAASYVNASYVAPGRAEVMFGIGSASWTSLPRLTTNPGPATITWKENTAGYVLIMYWRTADSASALASAAWSSLSQNEEIDLEAYYQFMATWAGFRCWASDVGATDDGSFAYAEDSPGNIDFYQGYAVDGVEGASYIEALVATGVYDITPDIEGAGTLTLEAPKQFDELVAGSHSGFLLNNRHLDPFTGLPAPLYSPRKSSFIFADDTAWYGKKINIEVGFQGFDGSKNTILAFIGRLVKWGPIMRAMSSNTIQPTTCALYALDWISDLLNQRVAMPAEDGTPRPLTYGEFFLNAQAIVGWSPDIPLKTAVFEDDNFNELDHLLASGGGTISLITPGLTKNWAMECGVTGANQVAAGQMDLPGAAGELFVTGNLRVQALPGTLTAYNCDILRFLNSAGATLFNITFDATGAIYSPLTNTGSTGANQFNILPYLRQKIPFAMWLRQGNPGFAAVWVNGSQVLSFAGDTSSLSPTSFIFGAMTKAATESWTVDYDDIQAYNRYYDNAFQVFGGPFAAIKEVQIDGIAQPDTQTVVDNSTNYTQTLTRFPQFGMVQFQSTDPQFKTPSKVDMRVVMNPGGMHPVDVIQALLTLAGVSSYIDASSFTAAKVATPSDLIHARFEDKTNNSTLSNQRQGLVDYTNIGLTVADAIKEVASRCLYFCFVDAGQIKLIPYTGIPPSTPILALNESAIFEADPTIDMDTLVTYVGVTYGAYATNPSLFYTAGKFTPDGQGASLDFTWASPVASEAYDMVKYKADLLLKFLSAQERLDPVRMNLAGMRLELMDQVSVYDSFLMDVPVTYWLMRKEIQLDAPHLASGSNREVDLQLMRFLGE